MKLDQITAMLKKDAVVAGYGMAASVWRKGVGKVLSSQGVGETGTDAVSLLVGTIMSTAPNTHVNKLGGALRIGSLVRMGNSLVSNFINGRKDDNSK